ncbi:hypothetical protein RJ641_036296 [Dillenia turbinata]|uniref:Uncharacterized protein n=1 Tax=Dillenia turbinata TaxID=194707 RepID=A0AAN8VU14_9MAGN
MFLQGIKSAQRLQFIVNLKITILVNIYCITMKSTDLVSREVFSIIHSFSAVLDGIQNSNILISIKNTEMVALSVVLSRVQNSIL